MPETSLSKVDVDFMRRNLEVSCTQTQKKQKNIAIQNQKTNVTLFIHLLSDKMSDHRIHYIYVQINLMGPVLVAKHLSPLMTTARKPNRVPSVLATISARVGSIGDNNLGGWLSYRASKAGQNQAMRTISIELGRRGVICASLHPGTVRTDLSAPFQKRVPESQLQDVDVAAGRLLDVIDSLQPSDNGSFFAYDGKRIPY